MQASGQLLLYATNGPFVKVTSGPRVLRTARRTVARSDAGPGQSIRLGAFELTRRISVGGQLELFRARAAGDRGPGCYLVKRPRRPGDPVAVQLLAREALVSSQVVHPHLTSVLAEPQDPREPFSVLPFLDGITLQHLRVAAGPAPLRARNVLALGRQLAAALAALHAGGWLHGQVRSEHVLVSPERLATLINLTRSRRLETSECDMRDWSPGSAGCLPPEAGRGRLRLTAAWDIYTLGLVLYELFAERPLASANREAPPPPADLRSVGSHVSIEVNELLRRMLAQEPLRRPSAEQVTSWCANLEIEELAALRNC